MIALIHQWFGWPDGAVLTNLVASLLLGVPVIGKLYHKIHKHQKRVEKHHADVRKHLGMDE